MNSIILKKEIRLSASVLSYCFIAFGLMFFIPGYPILCGAFFVTLGIFQSFQKISETNDILFSSLLPIAKKDVVKGKYLFSIAVELSGFIIMAAATILRMTVFSASPVYRSNALMNANLFSLGMALIIFSLFNMVFIGGFFKTAYRFGRPFVIYTVSAFIVIGFSESLHYFPGLEFLNAFGNEYFSAQLGVFTVCVVCSVIITLISFHLSCKNYERIDL